MSNSDLTPATDLPAIAAYLAGSRPFTTAATDIGLTVTIPHSCGEPFSSVYAVLRDGSIMFYGHTAH